MVLAPKMDKHKKKDRAGILLTCFFYIVISEENLFLLGKKVEKKKKTRPQARLQITCRMLPYQSGPVIWATVVSAFCYLR